MIPPYYCHKCDTHDREPHHHTDPGMVVVTFAILTVVAMMFIIFAYAMGQLS